MTDDRDRLMSPSQAMPACFPCIGQQQPDGKEAQQGMTTMRAQQQVFWMGAVGPTWDAIIRIEQDDGRGICVILPRRSQNLSGYNYHSNKCP